MRWEGGGGGRKEEEEERDPPSPWGLSGLASELEKCVSGLRRSMEYEAKIGCEHVSSDQDAGSKLWRARVGACGALADVIVGRSWQELGGGGIELDDEGIASKATASTRLLRLWRITMRS